MTAVEQSPEPSRPEQAQPSAQIDAQIDLLDPEGWRRRLAVAEIADTDAGKYALRSALCFDPDAGVRAAAATRLAALGAPAAWLREAMGDALPLVREAVIRGLGRLGDAEAAPLLARACRTEPVWWARRAAVLALAAVSGREAVPVLREVLDDPFWRVRYAAVQALAALGDEHEQVRAALASAPAHAPAEAAAIEYLRRHWHEAVRTPVPTPAPRADRGNLWDDDPAVMTARLEDPRTPVSPAVLVELLADSHEPLRKLAVQRLRAHGDLRAFEAAAIWLDEPRIPYAAETARALLERLGDAARDLVQQILDPRGEREAHGAGAITWALGWIGATRCEDLRSVVIAHLTAADAQVRAVAVSALAALGLQERDRDALARLLADPDADVRLGAASALAAHEHALRDLLHAVPYAAQAAPVRRVLAAAAADDAARDALTDAGRAHLAAALDDPDAQARAHALAGLDRLGELPAAERERARRDPDPWIRMAAFDVAAALEALAGDPAVEVRRAALAWLVRHRRVLAAAERAQAAQLAAASPDAWQRTRAAALVDSGPSAGDDELSTLLRLSHDHQPMVRAAARDALEAWPGLLARIEALLAAPLAREDAALRKAGYTWLLRAFDASAAERLARALTSAHEPEDDAVRAHLRAISAAFPAELMSALAIARPAPSLRQSRAARAPASRPDVARRALGRTGMAIAPLAISGVNDLAPAALRQAHEAGVDLFFWEPHHAALTRFLRESPRRRHALAIAAGTYHASPAAIAADVDTALRRLRTDHLDIFLLFWVRSRARLSDDALACLERLKAAGKIRAAGFSTHHRDIACEAIATQPWDVVMTRHSAAHPGAEEAFLPQAAAAGVGVLTFSALCYGRLLEASPDHPAPSAADCYRYSLSQPGVTACISAPQRHRELVENLAVLQAPVLAPAALDALRAHGRQVHARSRDFNELVRRFPAELPRSGAERLQALLDHTEREPRPLS